MISLPSTSRDHRKGVGNPGRKSELGRHGFGAIAALWALVAVGRLTAADSPGIPNPNDRQAVARGSTLARTYCVTCHLFPEPDAVDRRTWYEQVLPRMKYRLGFSTPELENSPNIRILRENKRIPDKPVTTESDWLDLCSYYLAKAPESPLPQESPPTITVGVPGFRVVVPPIQSANPSVTCVKILPRGGAMMADDLTQSIFWIVPEGGLAGRFAISNSVASMRLFPEGLLTAGLGSFLPTDALRGSVFWIRSPGTWTPAPPVLTSLPRIADANAADLNGDGRLDLVVCAFGNNVGRLSWWEALPDGGFREHELLPLPGALRTEIADFDGDRNLDIAVLVAQETEALFLFRGNGHGQFERTVVVQRPPYWGNTHFATADFNGDGRPDFLVTNGDNGEYFSASKRFHGIRILNSQPAGGWKEEYFFPLYGACQAVVRDFNGDGRLDVAAIAYYPDYQRTPRGSFVFLLNQGDNRFSASTFAESATGRWLALDAGDFDGDGDPDLLLGSYIKGPSPVPKVLMEAWEQGHRPLILLQNERLAASAGSKP